jgi:hypothetical protein
VCGDGVGGIILFYDTRAHTHGELIHAYLGSGFASNNHALPISSITKSRPNSSNLKRRSKKKQKKKNRLNMSVREKKIRWGRRRSSRRNNKKEKKDMFIQTYTHVFGVTKNFFLSVSRRANNEVQILRICNI